LSTDLTVVCQCGHPSGEHYSKPGWPACSKCTECKEFSPKANCYTDIGEDMILTSDKGEKQSIGRYGVWSNVDGKPQVLDVFDNLEDLYAKYGEIQLAAIGCRCKEHQ
tara:strand:- start:1351 stop:1674 length:324 start_codon:yes stop_codon:yes gene_type:complete